MKKSYALALCLLLSAGLVQAGTVDHYDAVDDFSLSSNPNGAWSYLYDTGTGPFLLTSAFTQDPGLAGWGNGIATPHWCGLMKNTTGATVTYNDGNTVQPADVLYLDEQQWSGVFVRWTAPKDGDATVTGRFQTIDRNFPWGYKPPELTVLKNSTIVWGPQFLSTVWGSTAPFDFTTAVHQGDTIDFRLGFPVYWMFQGTGLAAHVALTPEPTTAFLMGLALLGGGSRLRGRKRTNASQKKGAEAILFGTRLA